MLCSFSRWLLCGRRSNASLSNPGFITLRKCEWFQCLHGCDMLILTVCHVQWARGQNVTHGNSALVGLESADSTFPWSLQRRASKSISENTRQRKCLDRSSAEHHGKRKHDSIKGIVQLNISILSSFTHAHVVPNSKPVWHCLTMYWQKQLEHSPKFSFFKKSFLSTDLVVCEVLIIKTCCRPFFGGEKPTRLVNYCEHGTVLVLSKATSCFGNMCCLQQMCMCHNPFYAQIPTNSNAINFGSSVICHYNQINYKYQQNILSTYWALNKLICYVQ